MHVTFTDTTKASNCQQGQYVKVYERCNKKYRKKSSVVQDMDGLEPSYTAGGNIKCAAPLEKSGSSSREMKTMFTQKLRTAKSANNLNVYQLMNGYTKCD